MNLRRVRIQLTLLYSLLSALAVSFMAVVAINLGTEQIYSAAEREAEQVVSDVGLGDITGEREELGFENVFFVRPEDDFTEPLGEVTVEPPLMLMAEAAFEHPTFERFDQGGENFLAYARFLEPENGVIVSVIQMDEFDGAASDLRLRLWLAAIGSIVVASTVGWFLAGRSMRPARVAMEQQRNFIADAAHELRTPLSVIQASASQTLGRERDGPEYRASLGEIRAAAERAGISVGELLELARLDAGQTLPRRTPLRLDLLADEVASVAPADEVTVSVQADQAIVVEADYSLLRQAIDNLVRNASARASSVELTVAVKGHNAVVKVADDGPGFSDNVIDHVFERFRRGDEQGSSGLGMAIVRSIVEAHGGSCQASNHPEGGAVVTVVLPLKP